MLETIINNQGGNINKGKIINYTEGFMVGVSTIAVLDNTEELKANFSKYLELSQYMNIGFWLDGNSGKWYVDFSENIKNADIAQHLARERQELAIWDCAAFNEIRVA